MMTDPRQGVQTYGSVIHRRRMGLFISVSLSRTTAHSTGGQAEDTVISQACKLNKARWDLSDALERNKRKREREIIRESIWEVEIPM